MQRVTEYYAAQCHSERSEESQWRVEILRFAQNDRQQDCAECEKNTYRFSPDAPNARSDL